MATTEGQAHLLSLKVMRISRPELASAWQPFYSSSPSFSAHSSASILSLQGNTPLSGHPKTLRDFTSASEVLTLPASFGSIQLGETFSSCLCVNNESQANIEIAQVKVEMQTLTTKVILYEMEGLGCSLSGGDTLEHVVHHEIKELGQHVLACTVTYRLPPNARPVPGASEDPSDPTQQTFRKFYKFAVTNPLSVKTKVHAVKSPTALLSPSEREKIFLEVHMQNLTQDAIYFERMRLECTDDWEAIDGNMLPGADGADETSIFSGSMALMQPQDMRQYVYILTPKLIDLSSASHTPGSIIPLGRLDISWRSAFGEPGRLLTSMLSRRIPLPPAPQPASAVPPHLKKSIAGTQNRHHSSSISSLPHSRPGTPPLGQRPGSPVMGRVSISSVAPNEPQLAPDSQAVPLPDIEVQLVVRHIPREDVRVEKPFSIRFSVIISSSILPGRENLRRKVKLAIQHIRRQSNPPPVISQAAESLTPRVPSSGFSTPSSATATFNYALAHQKILAASSRPPHSEVIISELNTPGDSPDVLPPPYFEADASEVNAKTRCVSFVGPSAIYLPELEINYTHHSSADDRRDKVQLKQDFELSFIGLRTGFSAVGGIRILLADDQITHDPEQTDERPTKKKKIQVLKEYETVAEVWVA